jgi:hypothetical protein
MAQIKGIIALMGSGELTSTMVEVHKELLTKIGEAPGAVFLDTPAGFQLNSDQIAKRAVTYFKTRVQHPMTVVSFKSQKDLTPIETERVYQQLREAGFVLIGPGSPTYANRQLKNTLIPKIFTENITKGGCLVAASAAALTVGAYTLPVYEIYKVGQHIHWVDGLDILGQLGLRLVVIPHWNNAEGGSHDTRFCFMGKKRFQKLQELLPEEESILGIDEHTACIIDFGEKMARVRGIGRVVLKRCTDEIIFEKGDEIPLEVLAGKSRCMVYPNGNEKTITQKPVRPIGKQAESFWDNIHRIDDIFRLSLKAHDFQKTSNALLELDRIIWKAREDLESEEFISQAREFFREFIVLLGTESDSLPKSRTECLSRLVDELLRLREHFRKNKQWHEADALRDCLLKADIVIEDAPAGPRWHQRLTGS